MRIDILSSVRRAPSGSLDYYIVIDLENRLVLHDCADWNRVLSSKRFCKHVGKLLLSLDKEKASNILKQIHGNKEAWEFKPYAE